MCISIVLDVIVRPSDLSSFLIHLAKDVYMYKYLAVCVYCIYGFLRFIHVRLCICYIFAISVPFSVLKKKIKNKKNKSFAVFFFHRNGFCDTVKRLFENKKRRTLKGPGL